MADGFMLEGGIQVTWRRSARARRMTLRVPRAGGAAVLTLPQGVALSEGRAFAESKRDWLVRHVAARPAPRIVAVGAALPVEGRALRLTPASVRVARIEGEALLIPRTRPAGAVAQGFLKHLAQARLVLACDRYAAALGRPYRAISLRDTRSRWGSCSAEGRLMFSWRLAMAPPEVLDYVAAHEVAHLAHMDHSSAFWAACGRLCPEYRCHRDWLRLHGGALLLWRFRD